LAEEFVNEAAHDLNEEINSDTAQNDNEDDIVPKVHMCFHTLDAVKIFYRNFAIKS